SPLMLPLRALAFAALEGDINLLRRALISIVGGTLLAVALSFLIGWGIPIQSFGSEFQARVEPSIVDLGIAVAAGGISGFAKVRQGVSDALAGTAIAVALMPPICVVGLSLAKAFTDVTFWDYSQQAFLLYCTNLVGIVLACMLVFILAGYTEISHSVAWAVLSMVILVVPLGANFIQRVQRSQLEYTINQRLVRGTYTFGQPGVTLLNTRIDWHNDPPIVYLIVQSSVDITPKQVQELENFVIEAVDRSFKIIISISSGKIVTAEQENPSLEELPLDFSQPLTITPPPTTSESPSTLEEIPEGEISPLNPKDLPKLNKPKKKPKGASGSESP
ncbi:MAG: DUF389 domain-containing protein, partial [Kamptonema sp. SIO4C4]|nr:DUF389 domain-containing protein [Kamptonema sp. SIO4C4]